MFRRQSNTKPIIIGFLIFILIGLIIGLVVYYLMNNTKKSTGKVTAAPTNTKKTKKPTEDDEDDDDEKVAATKNSDSLSKNVYYSFVNSSTSYLLDYNTTATPDFSVRTWQETHSWDNNKTYFYQGFFLNSSDLIATCGDARVLSYNSGSKAFAWILNSNSSTSNKVVLKKIGSTNEYVIINETSNMILEHSGTIPTTGPTGEAAMTIAVKAPTKLTDTTSRQRWKIVPISGYPASTCKN